MNIRRLVLWLLCVIALVLLITSMAVPNLLRSRGAANEASRQTRERAAQEFQPNSTVAAAGPMITRTSSLALIGNEFDGARTALESISRHHNGYIAKLSIANEGGGQRTLSVTLRIPVDHLDATLSELRKLGRVQQESQTSEEVTPQYIDLSARLNNARSTEQRLVEVLRQRTGKVGDILEVEKQIGRVREEIERMDAQRRTLENQVSLASIDVRLTEEARKALDPTPPSAGTAVWNAMAEGFREAVEEALGLLLFVLHYGPSLLFWIAILFWPLRLGWRRLRA